MKTFTIRPFFNMQDKDWPVEAVIDLPQGATFTVEQFANFVYWHIHYNPNFKTLVKRSIVLATAGEVVPEQYDHVGVLLPYIEPEDTEEELDDKAAGNSEMPSEEEFYENYRLINVYAAPESPAKAPLKSWSFGKDTK